VKIFSFLGRVGPAHLKIEGDLWKPKKVIEERNEGSEDWVRVKHECLLTFHVTSIIVSALLPRASVRAWRAHDDRIVGMRLDMFLEVLWAFEGLATEFAFVRLEWDVDSNVRGDVVALDGRGTAATPLTGQVEVVGRFATDVALANMFLMT
jgi:hypothetical protein